MLECRLTFARPFNSLKATGNQEIFDKHSQFLNGGLNVFKALYGQVKLNHEARFGILVVKLQTLL